jgi:Mg2+-importing ATPase
MSLAILAFGVWVPLGPMASDFRLQPLPLAYFAWLAGILVAYSALTTLMKRWYIRRFGWQ